jgi:hypothetical protein
MAALCMTFSRPNANTYRRWVQTDMGNAGAAAAGMAEAPVTLKQSVDGILMKVCTLRACITVALNCKPSG